MARSRCAATLSRFVSSPVLTFSAPVTSLRAAATLEPRDISMAKAMASDAARASARHALQCHGAIGYTVEHDLHRFLKRTWILARNHGDAAWHRERIATLLEI